MEPNSSVMSSGTRGNVHKLEHRRYSKAAYTWSLASSSGCPCLSMIGADGLQRSLPTSTILRFYDIVKRMLEINVKQSILHLFINTV